MRPPKPPGLQRQVAKVGGRARSLAAFEALLADAGLSLAQATPTGSGLTIIEAISN